MLQSTKAIERNYVNFVWIISGFSCQSSMLTHIYTTISFISLILILNAKLTFLNVLSPAKMLPPIQVLYFLSGGAKILILMSLTASLCTSCNNRSPNPFVNVLPPDSTMLPKRDFRRSRSVRLMASTTIWWMPGYSRPMISGSKRISGARKRSAPIFDSVRCDEENVWFYMAVLTDLDFIPIRQHILHRLITHLRTRPLLLLPLRIRRHITNLLLNHPHDLLLRTSMKDVSRFP